MGQASARPGRLVRFEDAHHGACDGFYRRCGTLDDALAAYREGCQWEYRAETLAAVDALDDWRGSYRAFATFVGDVGRAFIAADSIDAYVGAGSGYSEDGMSFQTEHRVLDLLHDRWADDPYLGVIDAATGEISATAAPWVADLVADDQSGRPPWVDAAEDGSYAAMVLDRMAGGVARSMAGLSYAVNVRVVYEGLDVVVYSNGVVVARYTRAEVSARFVFSVDNPRFANTTKWLGRASNAAAFLFAGADQWFGDDGLPWDERLARALVRGGGVAAGGWLGGLGGGIIGAVLGGLGADWLLDQLPFFDSSDEPQLPLDYDREAVADLVASGGPEELYGPSSALVDLTATESVLADVEPGSWEEYYLSLGLPDREALLDIIDPPVAEPLPGPPTGTTTVPPTPTTIPMPSSPPTPHPSPPTTVPQAPPAVPVPGTPPNTTVPEAPPAVPIPARPDYGG